tara:strand:- start:187 stop:1317 length:1131 start_codon:yes stop_codon:yes gene_type:complete
MNVQHPLLLQIDINNCNNIHDAYNRILNLGLNAKIHDTNIIVKYPKNKKYSEDDYILKSRGIIIDFTNKAIINRSLDGCLSLNSFLKKIPDWDSIVIEECLDGTLINMYYYDNKWIISTKYCIDASESKFKSDTNFKDLFLNSSSINYDLLDKSYTYSFLLQHTETRNVSLINRNKLYHIESTNNVTGEKVQIKLDGIESPKIIKYKNVINKLNIHNISDLQDKLVSLHWSNPGYILYSLDRKYRAKLENPNFNKVLDLVKNQTNIKYLLLESLFKKNNIKDILKYYPEYCSKSVEINNDFTNYSTELLNLYIKCKVNNNFVKLKKNFKKPLCDLHNLFKKAREEKRYDYKINFNIVCNLLRNYDTSYLYSIIYPR